MTERQAVQAQYNQSQISRRPQASFAAVYIPFITTTLLWGLFIGFRDDLAIWIALLNSFICMRQAVLAAVDRNAGPIALTFWTFVFTWICVGSMIQLSTGTMPWPSSGTEDLYVWAQGLILLAFCSYILGTKVASQRSPVAMQLDHALPPPSQKPRTWSLIALGLVLVVPVIAFTGGLAARFVTREALGDAVSDSGIGDNTVALFVLNRLPAAVALVVAYASATAYRTRKTLAVTPAFVGWQLLFGVGLLALFANPFSSSRYIAFSAIAGLVLGLVSLRRPKTRYLAVASLLVATLVLYPLASWFKKSTTQLTPRTIDLDTFTGIDFDGFQMTVNAISFVNERGIAFGQHIVAAFAYFIPRSIWTSKPVPASFDVAAERGYAFQNLSLPLWSEFYLDLGLIGMIIAMGLFGYLSRRLDIGYQRYPGTLRAHLAVLFAVGQFGLIRGPLGGSVVFFGTILILGVFVYAHKKEVEKIQPAAYRPHGRAVNSRGTERESVHSA